MSNLTLCNSARDGKYNEVVDAFRKDPSVITCKDSCGRNVLHWSASGGHLELVKYLIEAGAKSDEADESGWTPLMISVSAGRDDVAEYLLKCCSANPNVINSTGQSPLHYAASKNRLNVSIFYFGLWFLPIHLSPFPLFLLHVLFAYLGSFCVFFGFPLSC
uniref:26S proteasome non-ATPase regulatory subunit 10 n=1 Tax=Schistocephalus solidus TaxID=70667 RepID=A0A0V0JCM6_SCHSO